jgi:hypothetical protein
MSGRMKDVDARHEAGLNHPETQLMESHLGPDSQLWPYSHLVWGVLPHTGHTGFERAGIPTRDTGCVTWEGARWNDA